MILRNLVVGSAHEQLLIQDKENWDQQFFRDHKNHPASLVTVVAFEPAAPTKPSQVSTFTGIVEIGIEKPRNCRRFWTADSLLNWKSVNSHCDRNGQGRDPRKCRLFWTLRSLWSSKSSNSHRDCILKYYVFFLGASAQCTCKLFLSF